MTTDLLGAIADIVENARRSAAAAANVLSSPDGRWAIVSSSVTALVAGSVAWLAAGTMPPLESRGYNAGKDLYVKFRTHVKRIRR